MKRVLESELMDDNEQASAYAQADFSAPHQAYVTWFDRKFPDRPRRATVLDIGCGSGDVTTRFAGAYPGYTFHAVDGSAAMLKYGRSMQRQQRTLARRIRFLHGRIPEVRLPRKSYDVILSTSLLHHLPDPQILWTTVRQYSKDGTSVFVADLTRPSSRARARALVERYAREEPDVLRRDFFNSLLAAFTLAELRSQLKKAGLEYLIAETISDRHVVVHGRIES